MFAFSATPSYARWMAADSPLEFRILGPLEVWSEGRSLVLGSPKQRALLAVLLLHANEPLSRDRLVDELWGETPPATVNAALSGYLTKLRRVLANGDGESALATRAPGYVLHVEPDALDAAVFERLVGDGRAALGRGEADEAAARLGEALALWRGRAMADLADEPFAQPAIRRLEELRVAAAEERIEADLALGRHDALVPELEALVSEQPYRERLRAQLIVALYRSGRQADALAAYRTARRTLADELGLEPSRRLQELEQAILHQDPALAAPAVTTPLLRQTPRKRRERPRRWPAIAVAAALTMTLAVGAGASQRSGPSGGVGGPTPVAPAGNSVLAIDPRSMSVVGETPLGATPTAIAIGEGSVWATIPEHWLVRIDPRTRKVRARIPLGTEPLDVAAGNGAVWVLNYHTDSVVRVDPRTDAVVATIPLRGFVGYGAGHLVVGGGSVWVVGGRSVFRIEPATNTATEVRPPSVWTIDYGDDALWVQSGRSGSVFERVVPSTNAVLSRFHVGAIGRGTCCDGGFAYGAGAVWTGSENDRTLFKLNPDDGHLLGSVNLEHRLLGIAFGEGAMWVLGQDGTVIRVDPTSEAVTKTVRLDVPFVASSGGYGTQRHRFVAAGGGAVWIAAGRWP
jgi:DNA-binding SARP family transcriptional activator/streptogramin lyase